MFGSIALKGTARSGQVYDGTVNLNQATVLERYRDSEALVEHAGHLGDLGRASELLREPSFTVLLSL